MRHDSTVSKFKPIHCRFLRRALIPRAATVSRRPGGSPAGGSPTASAASLTNDVVGPFHQGNVDRNRAPLRVPTAQVRLRDPTGPGAGSSRKYRDAFGYNFRHGLA